MLHYKISDNFSKSKIKFIKSLGLKKYRLQESSFILEGEKNVTLLLTSSYEVTMVIGTAHFLNLYAYLLSGRVMEIFQVEAHLLRSLGTFQENNAALAVATIPANKPVKVDQHQYGLVLDGINNPGNLGTILRVADWYGIGNIICSTNTVELYNPKVLHASMGSFLHVNVYYTELTRYLAQVNLPIVGTFTTGENLHDLKTTWPSEGLIVIGNEAHGISQRLIPYIQQKISIPRYGHAESLNAALATAVVCDNLRRYAAHNRPSAE